jgi:hypothetical protein
MTFNGKEGTPVSESNVNIMSGDSSAAQQYLDTFRRSEHLEPERALIAAILEDAIHEYRRFRRARDTKGKERFREAEQWIVHGGNDWIFSFENVCDFLGLDPDCMRRRLLDSEDVRTKERQRPPRRASDRHAA